MRVAKVSWEPLKKNDGSVLLSMIFIRWL